MKRYIIIALVLVVLVGGVIGWQRFQARRERQALLEGLQTERVEEGTLVATIGATGRVRSNQSALLAWKTSGTVEQVDVAVGDEVVLGAELASLSQTSLPQSVILAQADLVSAQQALDDLLESDLQRAQAKQAVEDAQNALEDLLNSDLQRTQAQQAVAEAELAVEQAETNLNTVTSAADQAAIDEAEAQVVLLADELSQAQENYEPYEDKPEDNLERARLKSVLASVQQRYDDAVRYLNALKDVGDENEIAEAEADLAVAQANLAEAKREYERVKDGPTEADIELLEAQLEDAQREWERVEDGVPSEDIEAAQARVAAAQATLDQARINAPFAGVITLVENKPGDKVEPGTLAFRLDDLSRLLVDLEVSEVDVNRIDVGQNVTMTFDAVLAKEYHGEVIEVDLVGTEVQGVVNFTVTVELNDPDGDIRPGMTSAVNIVIEQLDEALLIPNRAVRVVEEERVVFVLKPDNSIEKVAVTLGASSDESSEVVGGELEKGDEIIINPPPELTDQGAFSGPPGGGPPGP
jgi:HlyD family secretion protein